MTVNWGASHAQPPFPDDRQTSDEFPPIRLTDMITWHPHHGWGSDTSWVDGYLTVRGSGARFDLDIGSIGDDCCVTDLQRLAAQVCWADSGILFAEQPASVPAIIIPEMTVTTDLITAALHRAYLTGVITLLCGSAFN
jgi:hypothetical protein